MSKALRLARAGFRLHVRKKRASPEHDLQKAVAQYLDAVLVPPVFWTSVDHGAGKMSKAAAGIRKARGVRAGLPDVWIFAPGDGYCNAVAIELKSDTGYLSKAQRMTGMALLQAEVSYHVARSLGDVERILFENYIPTRLARAA